MAVKQNNTELNGTSAEANQIKNGNGIKSNATGTKSKKMNSNVGSEDSAGNITAGSDNADISGCSGSSGTLSKTKAMSSIGSNMTGVANNAAINHNDMKCILNMIEWLADRQEIVNQERATIYQHLIFKLALVQIPRQSEALKRFKEDMAKVGAFFAKPNDKGVYKFCLHFVCKLITVNGDTPSCAIAVIFELFSPDMISEAVESLVVREVSDEVMRKTIGLLCEWLRTCNFCHNLNLWIKAILIGLQKQQKLTLLEEIALDNIKQLFESLIIPALRPKVAPIVWLMLSSADQTPYVFHKILPTFTTVVKVLRKQSNGTGEVAESAKKSLQQLVDLTSDLMVRFYGYDDLYEPIEQILKDFQPSLNYRKYASLDFDGESFTQHTNAKVGLVNLGNTCYMNSVLQALAMTKEFSREILLSKSKSPLLVKVQQQIALMLYSSRHELTPIKVLNATRPPGFSPGLQQDSSEFLGYLLETLHEQEVFSLEKFTTNVAEVQQEAGASAVCKDNEVYNDAESIRISSATNNRIFQDTTQKTAQLLSPTCTTPTANMQLPASNSTIEKTFTGKLATTYKCLTCGWKSRNVDSFRDLQLSFPDVKNDCASNYSVQDLIEYYCSPEKLDGDNQYYCERCRKLSDAERFINVISAPKNLILTLKHFKYDQKYNMRAKLMHKVFHDEKVSVKVCSPETLEEVATVHYDLYAGVVHSGFSMDSGHYYTYAADATNKWYKFNDNIVTLSKTEELHNLSPPNTPYILFYQMSARSNETQEASTKVIKVDIPEPLSLEELPLELREMIKRDNKAFTAEMRHYKNANLNVMHNLQSKQTRDGFDDDEDDQSPPASSCGGNAMNINMNRFVY
uniref:USP domain-containing protein n=1 Tax=Glossina pallidipes TaxID=7398 RepID=A0A1A9ZB63_GLOPL